MTTNAKGLIQTDTTGFPPAAATIIVTGQYGSAEFLAPRAIADLDIDALASQVGRDLAGSIFTRRQKLYSSGSITFGRGVTATITGQK